MRKVCVFFVLATSLVVGSVVCLGQDNTYPWPTTGSVGIGTTSPGSKLVVAKSISSSSDIALMIDDLSGSTNRTYNIGFTHGSGSGATDPSNARSAIGGGVYPGGAGYFSIFNKTSWWHYRRKSSDR